MELRAEEQMLRDELKEYLICNNLSELQTDDGDFVAKVSYRRNMTFREELMVADGIDPMKYKAESVTKSFTIKPIKTKE